MDHRGPSESSMDDPTPNGNANKKRKRKEVNGRRNKEGIKGQKEEVRLFVPNPSMRMVSCSSESILASLLSHSLGCLPRGWDWSKTQAASMMGHATASTSPCTIEEV